MLEQFKSDPTVDMKTPPIEQVATMTAAKYYSYGAELMKVNSPHVTDWSTLARIKRIGIVPGESFDFAKASSAVKAGLERAVVDGLQLLKDSIPRLAPIVNGWVMSTSAMGVYGNFYTKRAGIAMIGLGANQPQDAIYPMNLADAEGKPLEGGKRYILHFSKAQLPPVDAFWSITMYDATHYQVANKLNRFAIGDRDALEYNDDGSLDIYIQHESPGKDKESNWLPSPAKGGPLSVTMRLYAPKPQALDGRWVPPAIKMTASTISSAAESVKVTVFNFVRAETDMTLKRYADQGAFGKLFHIRQPVPIDKQDVIRMNRDTLYSAGIFDLTEPVTITKPESGDRFQSMMIINQDHSAFPTEHGSGNFTLTKEKIGTRYVAIVFRTFVKAGDPNDIKLANVLQDQITFMQADPGTFEIPNWDEKSLGRIRDAINVLAADITDFSGLFGDKSKLDPIKHLLGTAYGWGGNTKQAAMYVNVFPEHNDGATPYTVTVKDVPVDGFWSITVYNAKGFMEINDLDVYSYNNITAKPNDDGSFTIDFGGDPKQQNYIPITKGWNCIIRMYQPRKEILDGSWRFPRPREVK